MNGHRGPSSLWTTSKIGGPKRGGGGGGGEKWLHSCSVSSPNLVLEEGGGGQQAKRVKAGLLLDVRPRTRSVGQQAFVVFYLSPDGQCKKRRRIAALKRRTGYGRRHCGRLLRNSSSLPHESKMRKFECCLCENILMVSSDVEEKVGSVTLTARKSWKTKGELSI